MSLRQSLLRTEHERLGAKLVEFSGWEMPLSYPTGTVAEHLACRHSAVAFDVSHLGTVSVAGANAYERLQEAFTNDLGRIAPGRAQYTHLLDNHDASVLDDCIIWWDEDGRFDVMPNASNTSRVLEAIGGVDVTDQRAIIAIQGPSARRNVSIVAPDAALVPHFGVAHFVFAGTDCVVAGTGYTGEDGIECAIPASVACQFWQALLATDITPAGLGARDTLRLEAGLPLHSHELGPGITPLQAGLGWVVGWNKPAFRGKEPLEQERERGVARRLRGLVADGRRPPRAGDGCLIGEQSVGVVTSGNFSPMLEHGIALAFLPPLIGDGSTVVIDGRGSLIESVTVKPPFWRSSSGMKDQANH